MAGPGSVIGEQHGAWGLPRCPAADGGCRPIHTPIGVSARGSHPSAAPEEEMAPPANGGARTVRCSKSRRMRPVVGESNEKSRYTRHETWPFVYLFCFYFRRAACAAAGHHLTPIRDRRIWLDRHCVLRPCPPKVFEVARETARWQYQSVVLLIALRVRRFNDLSSFGHVCTSRVFHQLLADAMRIRPLRSPVTRPPAALAAWLLRSAGEWCGSGLPRLAHPVGYVPGPGLVSTESSLDRLGFFGGDPGQLSERRRDEVVVLIALVTGGQQRIRGDPRASSARAPSRSGWCETHTSWSPRYAANQPI